MKYDVKLPSDEEQDQMKIIFDFAYKFINSQKPCPHEYQEQVLLNFEDILI